MRAGRPELAVEELDWLSARTAVSGTDWAVGQRARGRAPDSLDELTPQDLQVAQLVASGVTNKEVASELFLSVRTIDAHLRSVFRKLGISSRRQLRELLRPGPGLAPGR